MPSPGVELEPQAAEPSEPPSTGTGNQVFSEEVEDFTKDIEVGRIDVDSDKNLKKKDGRHRPRKKKLYAAIRSQLEFYFSDANISKNRMMLELITKSEYVDLAAFLDFNKIQKLSPEMNVTSLQRALADSTVLELSPDLSGVKRKVPYDPQKCKSNDEIEKCTVYVENVPTHVDHEWLEKMFGEFGPISYVAMPKFRHSGLPKGFAFVEFKEVEGAEHCLNAYGDKGACLPDSINPEELQSVRTFEQPEPSAASDDQSQINQESQETQVDTSSSRSNNKKRPREEDLDTVDKAGSEVLQKRTKIEPTDSAEADSTVQTPPTALELEDKAEKGTEIEVSENNGQNGAEKKKRRKTYKTKKMDSIEKRESDSIQLRILPKKIWRQLRNRYLNLQRENLGKLKRQLRIRNQGERYHDHPREPMAEKISEPIKKAGQEKNLIAKIEFEEPMESTEVFKTKITTELVPQESASILQYVDYVPPNCFAYVRLDGSSRWFEGVGDFLRNATKIFKDVQVLNEKEMQDYWAAVRHNIKAESKKKVRGRDKLLQQAMRTATHIRFGEEEGDPSIEQEDKIEDLK